MTHETHTQLYHVLCVCSVPVECGLWFVLTVVVAINSFYTCYQILLNRSVLLMGMKRLGLTFWDDTKYTKRLSVSPASLEPRPFWPCKKGVQTNLQPRLYQKSLIAKQTSPCHNCHWCLLSQVRTPFRLCQAHFSERGLKPCYDTFFQLAATFLKGWGW